MLGAQQILGLCIFLPDHVDSDDRGGGNVQGDFVCGQFGGWVQRKIQPTPVAMYGGGVQISRQIASLAQSNPSRNRQQLAPCLQPTSEVDYRSQTAVALAAESPSLELEN